MLISLQCPECGKGYGLGDELAGKRVKCRCGTVMTVPTPTQPDQNPGQPAPAAPAREPRREDTDPTSSATEGLPRRRKRRDQGSDKWRVVIGVLSVVYGTAMVPVILATGLSGGPFGLLKTLTEVVLAVAIVAGGVLILKRNKQGPACAGLSCLFLCFFPAWKLLLALLSTLTTGELMDFLAVLLASLVLYSAPVPITIWCLRQETSKSADSEFPP